MARTTVAKQQNWDDRCQIVGGTGAVPTTFSLSVGIMVMNSHVLSIVMALKMPFPMDTVLHSCRMDPPYLDRWPVKENLKYIESFMVGSINES